MKDLETVSQDYAKRVIESHPEAKNAEGLIATAVVYGANEMCNSLDEMDFGDAIRALKLGRKVARKGWNGKGMFLWLKYPAVVKAEWCKDSMLKALAEANGGEIPALGTICMFTAQKQILSGWLASQSDMLATDWIVVA